MIEMNITSQQGIVPVTILHLHGQLDGSNYDSLVAEAQKLFDEGVRDLVLDMENLSYLSSAGISALHRVALLFRGKMKSELEEGWSAFHAIDRDRTSGTQEHVKLLNPPLKVEQVLKMVGFDSFFEVYSELKKAVMSFH